MTAAAGVRSESSPRSLSSGEDDETTCWHTKSRTSLVLGNERGPKKNCVGNDAGDTNVVVVEAYTRSVVVTNRW